MATSGFDLTGRVALVTGGGTGLGRGSAAALREAGASVVVAGRRVEVLTATASQLGADWVACDVTDPASVEAAVRTVVERHGSLDILVNRRIPLGGPGLPEDLGGTVVYLAAAASDYVTGELIRVDGGVLAG